MYPITYVTDCSDGNARARLSTRIGALFGQPPTIIAADVPEAGFEPARPGAPAPKAGVSAVPPLWPGEPPPLGQTS